MDLAAWGRKEATMRKLIVAAIAAICVHLGADAAFAPKVVAVPDSGGTVEQEYRRNTNPDLLEVTAIPSPGYSFAGWYTDETCTAQLSGSGSSHYLSNPLPLEADAKNLKVYARFDKNDGDNLIPAGGWPSWVEGTWTGSFVNVVPADDGTSEVLKGSYSLTLTSTGSREKYVFKYAFADEEIDESTDDIRGWKIVAASSCHVVATGWCWDDEEEDRFDVTYVFRDATCTCNEGKSSFKMRLRNGDDTVEGTLTKAPVAPKAVAVPEAGGTVEQEHGQDSTSNRIEMTAIPSPGYSFAGWYTDEACTVQLPDSDSSQYQSNPFTLENGAHDYTVYAKFDKKAKTDNAYNLIPAGGWPSWIEGIWMGSIVNVVPEDDGNSEVFKGSYSLTLTSTGSREKYVFDDGEIDESANDIRGWKIVATSSCHVVATGWCWDDEEKDKFDVTYVFRDTTCTCNGGKSSFRMQLRNGDDTVEGTLTKTAYGPFAPGAKVSMVLPSLVGYTAKGLPAGLKFNQKTGTISGVATKPTGDTGVTVTFTKKGAPTLATQFVVGPFPNLFVEVEGEGKVTGAGTYTAGKKVTLKATAAKGYVFAGWSTRSGEWEQLVGNVDYRSPSCTVVVGESDEAFIARFEPEDSDYADISVNWYSVKSEYAKGAEIAPIYVNVNSLSLPTVKVEGLPPGLKFTAKAIDVKATKTTPAAHYDANTVYGTPTKSGVYRATFTVTTAGRKTATTETEIIVIDRAAGENILRVYDTSDWGTGCGKVTGAGTYVAGKKVTLKATAAKGYAFAGWMNVDLEQDGVDYRSPSLPYVMPDHDETIYARFVSSWEDSNIGLYVRGIDMASNGENSEFYTSGKVEMELDVQSYSLPKVVISGLPTGVKFDAKENRISGTISKAGTYTVTAKLANASVKKDQTFRIVVDNLTGANDRLLVRDAEGNEVALLNSRGDKYMMSVGVKEFNLPVLNAVNVGDTVTLAGLPSGLKYNAKTGKIEGIATKTGAYTVSATVKSGAASYVSTFTVDVKALPAWAVGTFAGVGYCDIPGYDFNEDNLYGTVTIGADGKVSGKFLFDTDDERLLTATFSAPALTGWDGYDTGDGLGYIDVTLDFKDGKEVVESRTCRFFLHGENGDGIGSIIWEFEDGGVCIELHQNIWKVKGFKPLPVFAEKKTVVTKTLDITGSDGTVGTSTLTLAIDANGAVSATLVEKGVERGKPFHDKYAFKGDLTIDWIESWDGGISFCSAKIPFVIGTTAVMRVDMKMYNGEDGKIHAENCEITSDFAARGNGE